MVTITTDAINDVLRYYLNVSKQYPNTWSRADVYSQTDKVIDDIQTTAEYITTHALAKQQTMNPLLSQLQANGMVEATTQDKKWSFTLRHDDDDGVYYVDNAVRGANMSNRAYRRGTATPNAPLSMDDRNNQNKKILKEEDIRQAIKEVLQEFNFSLLLEKLYNPKTEPMIDYELGEYDVLDGSFRRQILDDLKEKGKVLDIRMYSNMRKGGNETYALYFRDDNKKYFFTKILDIEGEKYLRVKAIPWKSVPPIIWKDAKAFAIAVAKERARHLRQEN